MSDCKDIRTIRELHSKGFISDDAFKSAMRLVRPPSVWFSWVEKNLLLIGSVLLLVGVIFFFAHNWASIGRFMKLSVLEISVAACAIGALVCGLKKFSGKILLFSASVLVGVLLAVFGQIYQTGADAYSLFVGWAVLISGWVIISEFIGAWLLLLLILNTGLFLYYTQVLCYDGIFSIICLLLSGLNIMAMSLMEYGIRKKYEWIPEKWFRPLLIFAVLMPMNVDIIHNMFFRWLYWHGREVTYFTEYLSFIVWPVAIICLYLFYRYSAKSITAMAAIIFNVFVLSICVAWRVLIAVSRFDVINLFMFSMLILVFSTVAALWIKRISSSISKELDKNE